MRSINGFNETVKTLPWLGKHFTAGGKVNVPTVIGGTRGLVFLTIQSSTLSKRKEIRTKHPVYRIDNFAMVVVLRECWLEVESLLVPSEQSGGHHLLSHTVSSHINKQYLQTKIHIMQEISFYERKNVNVILPKSGHSHLS